MTDQSATIEHQQALMLVPPNGVRAIINSTLLTLALLLMLPGYLLIFPLGRWIYRPYAAIWYRIACHFSGLKIRVKGKQATDPTTLLVANHVSYLDIPLLGALTNATFISKADVADWPLFGFLAKISNTLFIDRKPSKARTQRSLIADRLRSGEPMILFAEGTSTRGEAVLPFKSTLFSVADILADDAPLTVQPISIAYTHTRSGKPLDGISRALYGWYGDMDLMPHLKAVMGLRGVQVEVTFHPPITACEYSDRKTLAADCQKRVADGLAESLGGRSAT